jgi:8-oxo-dGTP pyrophosphatase MutT (NUDIX family)
MRRVEIVLGLLQQDDMYLLQHRLGDAKIGAAGLIGCFGGKINGDEQPHEAVARELSEETTFESSPEAWQLIGEVDVESDHQLEAVHVHATAYRQVLDPLVEIEAKEGMLIQIRASEIAERLAELTPATRALFETFFKDEIWL